VLTGESVVSARTSSEPTTDGWVVSATFREGVFPAIASDHVGQQLVIVLDGVVLSVPVIAPGITGNEVQIAGDFSKQQAENLAIALRLGSLPVELEEAEVRRSRRR
jgi:preprotein translocase subunit SecD